jgi:regulator of sigma E protease
MTTLLSFIFVLGLLIFIHELGHFLAAKWAGIRVERFSLGFPPRMIGKKIGDTDYCISWIPLGGYVKMAGMIDESMDTQIEGKPDEFMSKPIWQRAIVIAAGPFMNVLLALVFFAGLTYHYGIPEVSTEPLVGSVLEDYPAQEAGLQAGDLVLRIDGQEVHTWRDLTTKIHSRPDSTVSIEWERDGMKMQAMVKPKLEPREKIGLIGIGPKVVTREVGLGEAMGAGAMLSWQLTAEVGKTIWRLLRGEGSKDDFAGPLQIMKLSGDFARQGFAKLMEFIAILSMQLGLLNILPIPVLDGGHLVFLGLEGIMRRPISIKTRLVVQQIGMALLLALMVFIIINDFQKIKIW